MPGIINDPAVALYVATAVALVVMIGFFVYLWRMDRNVSELRRMLDGQAHESSHIAPRNAAYESEPLRPQRIDKELSDGLNRR